MIQTESSVTTYIRCVCGGSVVNWRLVRGVPYLHPNVGEIAPTNIKDAFMM